MDKSAAKEKIVLAGGAASLGFVFASVWSIALQNIFLVLAVVAAVALLVAAGPRAWRDAAPRWSLSAAVFFLIVAAASVFLSNNRAAGLADFPTLLLLLATPLAFLPFAGSKPLARHCMNGLAAGTLLGIIVMFCRIPKDGPGGVRHTPFLGIMNYGGALGALYPLALALFLDSLRTRQRGRSLFYFAILAMLALGALMNGTRIIWLSFMVTTLFLLLTNLKSIPWRGWLGLAVLALASALFFCASPAHMERVLPSANNTELRSSNRIRVAMLTDALKQIPALPLFGLGLGAAPALLLDANQDFVGYQEEASGHYHNTFLNTLVEMGWPGLAALLGLFVPSALLAARNFLSSSGQRRLWSRILFAVLLAFVVHSMTDTLFEIKSAVHLYGFLLTLCWVRLPGDGRTEAEPLA